MRKPYHPPALSAYLPPQGNAPGYLMGATGPQGFGSAPLFVAQIPSTLARQVIQRHHYSHSVVNNSYIHLGVYREGAFEGVLQWGYALRAAGAGRVVEGTVQGQYLELNRMWISDDAPRNTESRAMLQPLRRRKLRLKTAVGYRGSHPTLPLSLSVSRQAANG